MSSQIRARNLGSPITLSTTCTRFTPLSSVYVLSFSSHSHFSRVILPVFLLVPIKQTLAISRHDKCCVKRAQNEVQSCVHELLQLGGCRALAGHRVEVRERVAVWSGFIRVG